MHFLPRLHSTVMTLLLLLLCSQTVLAQSYPREQRRQFVEGLLRTLVESQLDRDRREPDRPPRTPAVPELQRTRQQLKEFSTHSTQLVHLLDAHAARSPGARQLLADTLKLHALASHINRRAAAAGRLEDLQPDFRALDRDWRLLSHRLRRAEGLDNECLKCINRLNELDRTLCGLLGVALQVNYRELMAASAAVDSSLDHLIEDIQIELPRTRDNRLLALETGQVQQRARRFHNAIIEQGEYDDLVQRFRSFYDSWRKVAVKVWAAEKRHLERSVRRIDETTMLLHELLLITRPVDYAQLVHLTKQLSRDVDVLFKTVSLNVLLDLPRPERVLPTASEFYGLCENFTDSVATEAPLEQLRSDYRFLVGAWPELAAAFRAARQHDVIHSLSAIEESFVALRDVMGLRPSVDWRRSAELGAALSVSADRLTIDVQRFVFRNNSYGQQFRVQAVNHAANFRGAARRLHEGLVRRDETNIADHCEKAAELWESVTKDCLGQLSAPDRRRFDNVRTQITEQVVQLQAMLRF